MSIELIRDHARIEEIMRPYQQPIGVLWDGLYNHAYRMLNFALALSEPEPGREDRIAIMAGFHDLPVCLDGDLVYLERAGDLADEYLAGRGESGWAAEMRLMITNHHRCRRYTGPHANLVEATRKADWIDVSFGRARLGVPEAFKREVDAAFPLDPLIKPALKMIGRYMLRHPLKPLPMLRW